MAGLTFDLYGHDVSASRTIRGVSQQSDSASKKVQSTWKRTAGMLAGAVAAGGVVQFFRSSINEARESQKVSAQTGAVIKSTGGAAGVSAKQVGDLATQISNYAGVDDEAIQAGENLLLTFTGIQNKAGEGNDIFNQTSKVMQDMATAMGTDASSQAVKLGKALNDPAKGLTALTKVGVVFTQQQRDQIKAMTESGNTLGAQKIILAELTKEFGGSAAAQATAADKAKVAWANVQEQVGTALIPVLDDLAHVVTDYIVPAFSSTIHWLQQNWHWLKYVAGAVGGMWVAWKGYKVIKGAVTSISGALGTIKGDFAAAKAKSTAFFASMQTSSAAGAAGVLGVTGALVGIGYGISQMIGGVNVLEEFNAAIDAGKESQQEWTQALKDSSGALTEQIRQSAALKLQESGVADMQEKNGRSLTELTDAVFGTDKAFLQYLDTLKAAGDLDAKTATTLVQQHHAYEKAAHDAKTLRTVVGDGTIAQGLAGVAFEKTTKKIDAQTTAADKLLQRFDKLSGNSINVAQAQLQFMDALAQAKDMVDQNGESLQANTVKGRANREWLLTQLSALKNVAQAQLDNGQKVGVVTDRLYKNREALRAAARAAGLNKDEVDALIKKYGHLPAKKTVPIETPGVEYAINKVQELHDAVGGLVGGALGLNVSWTTAHNAQGTGFFRGGGTWVGENGPEMVKLPYGAQVNSATQSASISRMNGSAQPVVVHVDARGAVITPNDLSDLIVDGVERGLNRGRSITVRSGAIKTR